MKSILVFIDGTICDGRSRYPFFNSPDFYQREKILLDRAVPGSIECLTELSQRYEIVYIGARPGYTKLSTMEWLEKMGYPKGPTYLAKEQEGRLQLINEIKGHYDFIAGIGDRWDDNELHLELDCLSIILQEHEGRWDTVIERIDKYHRKRKLEENRIHLRGKVEGLARVCPLLLSRYGLQLWEAYFGAVMEMAENSRETRRAEDLASFAQYNLDPKDLRDAARWDELTREEDWQNNSTYGLQSSELVEATEFKYIHKITRCSYAELWKRQGRTDIGYQIHCRTDFAWWDRPAWNPEVRFEQPETIMQGNDQCLFIQYFPEKE
jgi:soluble P-type ATPase